MNERFPQDVWDTSVVKPLDCIDSETPSKLLISTRISGLLSSAREVQLALLTPQEALTMLMDMAGVDVGVSGVPAEAISIINLCGRLPLCVSVIELTIYNGLFINITHIVSSV